jgi:hypothetical protein
MSIEKYLICPEETLVVYGLLKEVDNYIDLKLGRFPLNAYQQNQMAIAKNKFVEGYMKINENSFKSNGYCYNPNSDKLTHYIKIKDEMVMVPDIGNTQAYSDDESSKAEKIAERMHNFI